MRLLLLGYFVTVRLTVVACEVEPLLPVMVMVRVPVVAVRLAVMVIVALPAPVMDDGLKLMVVPDPCPDALSAIAELKPPVTAVVTVTVPECDRDTERDVGAALMEKPAETPVTVSVTVVEETMLPEVPVTVMEYVPAAAVEPTVKLSVELPAPVMDVGLKAAVTPVGRPETVSAIDELKPPDTELEMVVEPPLLCAIDSADGDAERVKLGVVDTELTSALRRPVFGLPQPVTRS